MKECQITRGFSMKLCLKGPIRRIGTIGIYILLHLPGHIEHLHFVTLAAEDRASMAGIYKPY